jgi:hypothetical protein
MAASAAHWIGSQASEFYVTPSGLVGSIGVYTVHKDDSKKNEMAGITKTVIQAGKAKAGHEQPLNEYSRQNLQSMVDELYGDFVERVARSRNVSTEFVEENFGQGGLVTPKKALEAGMIDGIESIESLVGRMTENGGVIGNASAVAAMSALAKRGMIIVEGSTNTANLLDQDMAHGDPGPNGEPIPKEPESKDKAVEGGWRVPTPPSSSYPIKNASVGGKIVVNREQLEALATKLGIEFNADMTDEDLYAACMVGVDDVVLPIIEVEASVTKTRDFEKDYPEYAAELSRLRERDEENEARLFAERWERFQIEENGTTRKTTQGFSAITLRAIEDIHLKVSRRQLQVDDVTNLLDSIAQGGVVDYSEKGSARSREYSSGAITTGMTVRDIRQAYADEVKRTMEEDSVDRKTAMKLVADRNPDLAEMYRTGHLRVR